MSDLERELRAYLAADLPATCRECGNDDVTEGHPYCLSCLELLCCACRYRTDMARCSTRCGGE